MNARTFGVRAVVVAAVALAAAGVGPVTAAAEIDVRLDVEEAEAVLALLDDLGRGVEPAEERWQSLFTAAGYLRLAERETAMGRTFTSDDFRAFVRSPELAGRAAELRSTLASWRQVDPAGAGRRALAYLPAGARIRATVYLVIKPRDNSFVWDLGRDPAIFLYLDPELSAAQLENTMAHELHHIGFGTVCPRPEVIHAVEAMPTGPSEAVSTVRAFGEGFAMLAAAGGAAVHPHATSPAADRERWDRDVARVGADLVAVEAFLLDVAGRRLDAAAKRDRAMGFFGLQGPWYTVGWTMAAAIERARGREVLIEAFCDPRRLLPTYNAVAAANEPKWSPELLRALGGEPKPD